MFDIKKNYNFFQITRCLIHFLRKFKPNHSILFYIIIFLFLSDFHFDLISNN